MPQEELERNHRAMVVLYIDYLLWFVFAPFTLLLPYLFVQLILPWRDFPHWLFSEVPAGLLVTLQRLRYNAHRLEKYMPAEHGGIQDYRRWWLGGPKRQAFYTIAAIFCTTEVVQFWLWFTASGFFCPTICPGAYMGDGVTAPLYPFDKDPEEYNQNAWYSPTYNGTFGSDKNYTSWDTMDPDAPVPWISVTPGLWSTDPYSPQPTQTVSDHSQLASDDEDDDEDEGEEGEGEEGEGEEGEGEEGEGEEGEDEEMKDEGMPDDDESGDAMAATTRPLSSSSSRRQGFPGDVAAPSPRPGGNTRPVVTSFAVHPIPTTTESGNLDPDMLTGLAIIGPQVVVDEAGSTTSPPYYPPSRTQPD